MRDLRAQDLQDILMVSQQVLECQRLEDVQQSAMRLMQSTIGAESSVCLRLSARGGRPSFNGGMAHDISQNELLRWCDRYQQTDPFVNRYIDQLEELPYNVFTSDEVIDHQEYIASEFYNDFLQPLRVHHVMTVGLNPGQGPFGILGLHRSKNEPAFTPREISKAQMIAPYLSAAFQKAIAFDRILERERIIEALTHQAPYRGFLILDHMYEPIYVNNAALVLMQTLPQDQRGATADLINSLPDDFLRGANPSYDVDKSCSSLSSGQYVEVKLSGTNQNLSVYGRVLTRENAPHHYMIWFDTELQSTVPPMRWESFGFTRREEDVVCLVVTGLTNAEIADKLFISIHTVQNHLRAIYLKTNVHNRTSLVYRIARD